MADRDERERVWDARLQRQIKKLPPPALLNAAQLGRIAQALDHDSYKRPRVSLRLGAAAVAAIAFAGLIVLQRTKHHESANLLVPAGTLARVSTPTAADLLVLGPAALTIDAMAPVIRDGRLIVRTASRPQTVTVPEGRIRVRPNALAVIDVISLHTRVAAYSGSVEAEWREFPGVVEIGTSTVFSAAGVSTVSDAERRQIAMTLETNAPRTSAATPVHAPDSQSVRPPDRLEMRSSKGAVRAGARLRNAPAATSAPSGGREPEQPSPPPPGAEAEIVATAIRQLHAGAAADALASLEKYWMQHPGGELAAEAETTAIEALMQLRRNDDALARLDAIVLDGRLNAPRLAMIRGELRAERGRCHEALADFARAIIDGDPDVANRAHYDRGVCRARTGDVGGAREDFSQYLAAAPNGPLAESARRALRP